MTDNEAAIRRNDRKAAELNAGAKIANTALVGVVLALAVAMLAVITTFTAQNRELRAERDAQNVELRCRSGVVNEQAQAQANLSIEDAHNDSITSRGLSRISRGEELGDLSAELDASADRLDALSEVLRDKTEARITSVETCQTQED